MTATSLQSLHAVREYGVLTAAESRETFVFGPTKLHRRWGILYVDAWRDGEGETHWTVLSDRYPPNGFHGVWKIRGYPDEFRDGPIEVLPFNEKVVA